MSNQSSQRVRRGSPSLAKSQGPMRAVVPFQLRQSPTTTSRSSSGRKNSPSSSPTPQWGSAKSRKSPDHRVSPERASPCSPAFKVDKTKLRQSPQAVIKRTSSLDTIAAPYLKGEWPRDTGSVFHAVSPPLEAFTDDKGTQTPEEWDEGRDRKRKSSHTRSSSLGNADPLKKESIKARLAKTTCPVVRVTCPAGSRTSPVPGHHAVLPPSGSGAAAGGAHAHPAPCQATYTVPSASKAVTIPHIPAAKPSTRVIRGSVEGLNQEIEKLVLKHHSGMDGHCGLNRTEDSTPDGHRAPVRELLSTSSRTIDTQTPSGGGLGVGALGGGSLGGGSLGGGSLGGGPLVGGGDRLLEELPVSPTRLGMPCIAISATTPTPSSTTSSCRDCRSDSDGRSSSSSSQGCGGGRRSESPALPIIAGLLDSPLSTSRPDSSQDKEDSDFDPQSFLFVREPPDGCEKVKVHEDIRPQSSGRAASSVFCPIKKTSEKYCIPSELSAFCPLLKPYVSQSSDMAVRGMGPATLASPLPTATTPALESQ